MFFVSYLSLFDFFTILNFSNFDPLQINAQWEEAVKKESRGRILNENFDFNPKNLLVISDKPTNKSKLGADK